MFANFNRGIDAATGDFIAFFHDDDVYLPQFIEHELDMLIANPTAGIVGSNYYLIDDTSRVIGMRRLVNKTEVIPGRDFIKGLVWRGRNVLGTPGIMYRRELLSACCFDESLSIHFGDGVVLMRLAELSDVALVDAPLLQVRIHPTAASALLSASEAAVQRSRLLHAYTAEYAQRWPDDQAFVRSLQRAVRRSDRIALLWCWIAARDEAEAEECMSWFCKAPMARRLSTGLRLLNRLGFSPHVRHGTLAPLLRRFGRLVPGR
jgi:glycosyltransferase involved in cell wall biosynthesis